MEKDNVISMIRIVLQKECPKRAKNLQLGESLLVSTRRGEVQVTENIWGEIGLDPRGFKWTWL